MDQQFYFSSGDAARELGVSQERIVALCKAGAIECELTRGGQWRIPAREVERLKREGMPSLPRPMPGNTPVLRNAASRHRAPDDQYVDPHRAAGRAPEVVQAYAGVHRKRAMVESDELDVRQNEIALRKIELEAEIETRRSELQARNQKAADEARRSDWLRQVEEAGFIVYDQDTAGAEPEPKIRLRLHAAIRERFGTLDVIPTLEVTGKLLGDLVREFVDKFWEQKECDQIISDAALSGLPIEARAKPGASEISDWQMKLLKVITDRLGTTDHPLSTIRSVVKQAVAEVTKEFETFQRGERDKALRARIKSRVRASIPIGLTDSGRKLAAEAMDRAIDGQPFGTEESSLLAVANEQLQPFRDLLARSALKQRRQEMRKRVLLFADWKLPSEMPRQLKDQAVASLRQVFDEHPDAEEDELEALRDQTFRPHVESYRRQQEAEAREHDRDRKRSLAKACAPVHADVSAMYRLVEEMDRKGELEHAEFRENWALAEKLSKRVLPALVDLLVAKPDLSFAETQQHCKRLVDRHLDDCLAHA